MELLILSWFDSHWVGWWGYLQAAVAGKTVPFEQEDSEEQAVLV